MEAPTDLSTTVDALPIVEDDQQLYDWGIEHRLDQYYGNTEQQQQQYQLYQQQQQLMGKAVTGYVLPEHVQQQENSYLVTITADNSSSKKSHPIKSEPASAVVKPVRHIYAKQASKGSTVAGVPGRRPILPTVDMDANEILKVERKRARNRVAASKCRMRKLERIAVLDQQASALRADNEQLAKMADKLRSQVYSLKQELRWHVNNGCRIGNSCQFDQLEHPEISLPISTADKATETTTTAANCYEIFDNSPDSTTSSSTVATNVKKE